MLNERSRRVLFTVIESYIRLSGPVGSGFVARNCGYSLSPATARNIMSDLEEMGLLNQPHTSAGRIPTDKGYRLYVNSLSKRRKKPEETTLPSEIKRFVSINVDINSLLSEVARTLSRRSHFLGVAACARPSALTLNRIQMYSYRGRHVASVLFTDEGYIQHKLINTDSGLSQKDLNRISEYLNSEFTGRSIFEIQTMLVKKISKEKAICDIMMSKALSLCKEALSFPQNELFVSGLSEFLGLPDIAVKIREIAKTIEEKHLVLKLLDRISSEEGVNVLIGAENPIAEFRDLSIVASSYMRHDRPMGTIGVIGPTRMNYTKTIAMVSAFSRLLTESLSKKRG